MKVPKRSFSRPSNHKDFCIIKTQVQNVVFSASKGPYYYREPTVHPSGSHTELPEPHPVIKSKKAIIHPGRIRDFSSRSPWIHERKSQPASTLMTKEECMKPLTAVIDTQDEGNLKVTAMHKTLIMETWWIGKVQRVISQIAAGMAWVSQGESW